MRKDIFLTLTAIFFITFCFAQDLIITKTGEQIQAKIIEDRQFEIVYKDFPAQKGPVKELIKWDILKIRYENGVIAIFKDGKKIEISDSSKRDSILLATKAEVDVVKYYTSYRPALISTFIITGIGTPLIGLIPVMICTSTIPKDKNLNFPNQELMKNPDYYNTYVQKAMKMKQRKIWAFWTLGCFANIGFSYTFLLTRGFGSF
jgi:hypothetical protein